MLCLGQHAWRQPREEKEKVEKESGAFGNHFRSQTGPDQVAAMQSTEDRVACEVGCNIPLRSYLLKLSSLCAFPCFNLILFARLEPAGGSTRLVPQRPVLLLNGQIELQPNEVAQVM